MTGRNPDERMRSLQRRAATGDQAAAAELEAMRARTLTPFEHLAIALTDLGYPAHVYRGPLTNGQAAVVTDADERLFYTAMIGPGGTEAWVEYSGGLRGSSGYQAFIAPTQRTSRLGDPPSVAEVARLIACHCGTRQDDNCLVHGIGRPWRAEGNPRGDESFRRAQRGEGGDPKIEAWRRGLPVPPDRVEPLTPGSTFTMVGAWQRPDASTGAALWTWPEMGQRRIYSVPEEFVSPGSYPSRVARPPESAIDWLDPDVQLLASEIYMGRRVWHPHQYRTSTSKWPHYNPPRGDESLRRAQRGEGGDPKIEAWRRGVAVPPDSVWSGGNEWRAYWRRPGGGDVEVMLADVLNLSVRDLPVGAVVYPSKRTFSRAHQLYGWIRDEHGSHLVTPGTFVVWQVDPGLKGPDWLDPTIQSAVYAAYSGQPRSNPPEPVCPQCGGEAVFMGMLGKAQWFRCRACGWDWQLRQGKHVVRSALPADVCGWCAPGPCRCPRPKKNPRGDEAVRRAGRGEGGDPKIEAWRRGLPVPPDEIREERVYGRAFHYAYWRSGSPRHEYIFVSSYNFGGDKRMYSVFVPTGFGDRQDSFVALFDYGDPRWDEPELQERIHQAYRKALGMHASKNPRGDEAVRRPGEGHDPKIEAWRRGLAVPPDVVRESQDPVSSARSSHDWPAAVTAYWLTPGAVFPKERFAPAGPAVWPQAIHAMSWTYPSEWFGPRSFRSARAYRVYRPRAGDAADVTTSDYGAPRWEEPQVQELVYAAYRLATGAD